MTQHDSSSATKQCPYCAEEIKVKAKKCKHCGEMLVAEQTTSPAPAALKPAKKQSKFVRNFLIVAGIFAALSILGSLAPSDTTSTPSTSTAPSQSAEQHRQQFMERLRSAGIEELVVSSRLRNEDKLILTVPNTWHLSPYQLRLQAAQNLWNAWASIHSPNSPDNSRISIEDLNGNEVGGSRALAGSLIWVNED